MPPYGQPGIGPGFGAPQYPPGVTPGLPPGMGGPPGSNPFQSFGGGSSFGAPSSPGGTNSFGWGDVGDWLGGAAGSLDGQPGFGLGDILAGYGIYNAFRGSSKAGNAATNALGLQSALASGAAANAQELFAGARPVRLKAEELLMNRLGAGPGAGVPIPDLSSVVDTANPFRQNFGAVPPPSGAPGQPAPPSDVGPGGLPNWGGGPRTPVDPPPVGPPAEGPPGGHNSPPGAPPRGVPTGGGAVVPPPTVGIPGSIRGGGGGGVMTSGKRPGERPRLAAAY